MSKLYDIAAAADFEDEASREDALRKVRELSDIQLRSVAMISQDNLTGVWKKATVLASEEISRRSDEAAKSLARRSTIWAGVTAIAGVVVGAMLGAWLEDGDLLPGSPADSTEESR